MHIADPIHSPETRLQMLLARAHDAHMQGDKPTAVRMIESIFDLLDQLEGCEQPSRAA